MTLTDTQKLELFSQLDAILAKRPLGGFPGFSGIAYHISIRHPDDDKAEIQNLAGEYLTSRIRSGLLRIVGTDTFDHTMHKRQIVVGSIVRSLPEYRDPGETAADHYVVVEAEPDSDCITIVHLADTGLPIVPKQMVDRFMMERVPKKE